MNRQDIRNVNRAINGGANPQWRYQGLIAAVDRLDELYQNERDGMTVPTEAWEQAQMEVQFALVEAHEAITDAMDRSDHYQPDPIRGQGGNAPDPVDLPRGKPQWSDGRPQRPEGDDVQARRERVREQREEVRDEREAIQDERDRIAEERERIREQRNQ